MGGVLKYRDEIVRSMKLLSEYSETVFIGQGVRYPGHAMYGTLQDAEVPMEKRIEMPVAEDMQMGISIGMSLKGYVPISIYPRFDFLLLATNQIVNHLDKIDQYSVGRWKPKVIIRTAAGSMRPLFPGYQHTGDYTEAFRLLAPTLNVVKLNRVEDVYGAYASAYTDKRSSILVEIGDYYNEL